ncbi:unnamed protein product [Ceratitis capitata]|uniref:(Mediterranean fruit fly) hypothetical protein n=1 Tax=Ceratitis capitata TaxID=7213 RepID=A0A811V7H9_CERCA|nr:unnamed protein product [Ceratitis capitata]
MLLAVGGIPAYPESLALNNFYQNMALDGKTIIKEEITDKDAYEAAASNTTSRRNKAQNTIFLTSSKVT